MNILMFLNLAVIYSSCIVFKSQCIPFHSKMAFDRGLMQRVTTQLDNAVALLCQYALRGAAEKHVWLEYNTIR